jgi:threonyl-tRNA synthetase
VLIEHYAGAFPVWLAPVQVALIPIADRHTEYTQKVAADLKKAGLRVTVDYRSERMNSKIRDAQNQKIPYMLVIGDKEVENSQVALRLRNNENPGAMDVKDFITLAKDEVEKKI